MALDRDLGRSQLSRLVLLDVNLRERWRVVWIRDAERSDTDEIDIREFLERDYSRLVAAVTLVCGSRPAAEDAVQEALARAWLRSRRDRPIMSLPAWVTTVAMNEARGLLRRRRAEANAYRRVALRTEETDTMDSDRLLDARRVLARLPRRQREVTVLRYYLGLDVAQVASTLSVSEGTVKTCLFRARQALSVWLSDDDETTGASDARR